MSTTKALVLAILGASLILADPQPKESLSEVVAKIEEAGKRLATKIPLLREHITALYHDAKHNWANLPEDVRKAYKDFEDAKNVSMQLVHDAERVYADQSFV